MGQLADRGEVDQIATGLHGIEMGLVEDAGEVDLGAVGQVTTVRQIEAEDAVAWLG